MKTLGIEKTDLLSCVNEAQGDRVVITRDGKPVALMIGIDQEQLELRESDTFWQMIQERRGQETMSRTELERLIDSANSDG